MGLTGRPVLEMHGALTKDVNRLGAPITWNVHAWNHAAVAALQIIDRRLRGHRMR